MICNDKLELISAFIDGELSPRNKLELFKHIAACPDCRSFIDVMIRMREVEKKEQIIYPAEIDETLLSRLDGRQTMMHSDYRQTTVTNLPQVRHRVTLSVPVAIGAAAAAIMLGFLLSGIVFREYESSTSPSIIQSQYQPPTAVIFYYGMPPVEVTDTALIQTNNANRPRFYK